MEKRIQFCMLMLSLVISLYPESSMAEEYDPFPKYDHPEESPTDLDIAGDVPIFVKTLRGFQFVG